MKKTTKSILASAAFFAAMFIASHASAQQSNEQPVYTDAQIEQMKKDAEANNPNSYENKQSTDNGKKSNNTGNTDTSKQPVQTTKNDDDATEVTPKQ